MADWKDIGIADLERQIAELRANNERLQNEWDNCDEMLQSVRAENARLRALPLKDEVERVVKLLSCLDLDHSTEHDDLILETCVNDARALLSRLRTGEQEWWRSQAADDVLAERRRQVEAEGWTPEHDNVHSDGQMAAAAACYARTASMPGIDRAAAHFGTPIGWPWGREWWKPKDRRRDLVRAAALLIAEIERLDRLPAAPSEQGGDRG